MLFPGVQERVNGCSAEAEVCTPGAEDEEGGTGCRGNLSTILLDRASFSSYIKQQVIVLCYLKMVQKVLMFLPMV